MVSAILGAASLALVGIWLILPAWRGEGIQIDSIAVLPLANISGDPAQDYFADAMTDELITALAQVGALRVTSRTSVMQYKGVQKLREIARELNVDAVIEGSALLSVIGPGFLPS